MVAGNYTEKTEWSPVLQFWFGEESDLQDVIRTKSSLWWGKDLTVDRQILEMFAGLHDCLCRGKLDPWLSESRGALAYIIVSDQFSRNMYRGSPRAFAQDPFALEATLSGVKLGLDRSLRWIERVFFYMPLEHSEDPGIQEMSISMFEALCSEAPLSVSKTAVEFLEFARRHRDIILRFGRFPHRNQVLGRCSTDEEIVFLQQPGSSF